ncbi:MAG TPA: FAD-dependent oxidoreductase [Kiritimatiellia bacterium]|nr:FAD-dependent oxidoreductase [Kiritimatiellia bacterium]
MKTDFSQTDGLRIAVLGGGVAGLTAALLLQERHRVTLYERNDYIGGHTNTIAIPDGPDAGTPVDTGFIVLNNKTYPLFNRLLRRLDCPVRDSDMSFGYHDEESGLQYAGTGFGGLFAQPLNALKPSYWRFLKEITRFCTTARADLAAGRLAGLTVGEYLAQCGFSPFTRRAYILPMAGAIWSSSMRDIEAFPAEMMIRFWENHGLLSLEDRPQWMTVAGGSQSYVRRAIARMEGSLHVRAPVRSVRREGGAVRVEAEGHPTAAFDAVVLAAHADESLRMLADPSADEQRLLGAWNYQRNFTVLHTDESLMPPNRRAWASWNYRRTAGAGMDGPVPVTYHMNRLQGLHTQRQYFVTLNSPRAPRPETVIREIDYTHPLFSFASMRTQAELPALNGVNRTFFCGSYFGYGFHEDAVRSGVEVAKQFGIAL